MIAFCSFVKQTHPVSEAKTLGQQSAPTWLDAKNYKEASSAISYGFCEMGFASPKSGEELPAPSMGPVSTGAATSRCEKCSLTGPVSAIAGPKNLTKSPAMRAAMKAPKITGVRFIIYIRDQKNLQRLQRELQSQWQRQE